MNLIKISQHKEFTQPAACWFHEKWGIPLEAYQESIQEAPLKKAPVPEWYLAIEDHHCI